MLKINGQKSGNISQPLKFPRKRESREVPIAPVQNTAGAYNFPDKMFTLEWRGGEVMALCSPEIHVTGLILQHSDGQSQLQQSDTTVHVTHVSGCFQMVLTVTVKHTNVKV